MGPRAIEGYGTLDVSKQNAEKKNELFAIKLHYFLFYGGVGSVIHYIPIVGKTLGFDATSVGLIYTVLPLIVLFAKPAFGALTDRTRVFRLTMIVIAIVTALSFIAIIFVPALPREKCFSRWLRMSPRNVTRKNSFQILFLEQTCDSLTAKTSDVTWVRNVYDKIYGESLNETFVRVKSLNKYFLETNYESVNNLTKTILHYLRLCTLIGSVIEENDVECSEFKSLNQTVQLKLHYIYDDPVLSLLNISRYFNGSSILYRGCNNNYNTFSVFARFLHNKKNIIGLVAYNDSTDFPNDIFELFISNKRQDIEWENMTYCGQQEINTKCENSDSVSLYSTYQFWTFAFLSILSGTATAVMFCLSDACCYEIIGVDGVESYSKQRLWGAISWGLFNLLTGYLNEVASRVAGEPDYRPGFYIMFALIALDLIVLYRINIFKTNFTNSILKDVSSVMTNSEIVLFSCVVTVLGALAGLLWNYEFWYLRDMQATQLLLGLTVLFQCLIAEVPCLYVSGTIIEKIGHFPCLIVTLVAYGLRYFFYFLLRNPWYVLPVELLHGQCFGVFLAAMTSYAKEKSPEGTEATVLALLSGFFEGLGVAIGSVLSGFSFDHIGGRSTFLVASILSLVCAVVFSLIRIIIK